MSVRLILEYNCNSCSNVEKFLYTDETIMDEARYIKHRRYLEERGWVIVNMRDSTLVYCKTCSEKKK